MTSPIFQRLKLAAQVVFKSGAPFPFNRLMPYDATGEELYAPYKQSAWVQRAIKKVAGPISAVDLRFSLNGQPFDDAALDAFWRFPAAGMTRQEFLEATIGWLKLAGEAFWILDDTSLAPFPNPIFEPMRPNAGVKPKNAAGGFPPLIVARPDRMTHLVQDGELVGWQYIDGAGRHIPLLPEQVVQTRMWNPYDDWRGLAELHSCHDAAEADYLAGKFNVNLMRSNGDQGIYVIAKEVPTDAQRQQITDQLREKRELAQRGVFKPLFLTGDIKIEDARVRTPDADFVANRLENRHEIFLALGVPPSMADVRAAYSIGSASDWFILIAETCIPTGEKICQLINSVLRQQTGLEVGAAFDWDEHPVIQAVRRERAETAQKYWAMGVPLKVLSDYLDLELPAFPDWEQGYVPLNVVPVSEEGGAGMPFAGSEDFAEPFDDTIALMRQALDPRAGSHKTDRPAGAPVEAREGACAPPENCRPLLRGAHAPSRVSIGALADGFSGIQIPSRWERYMLQRRETIRAYESRFTRQLMIARAEVLSKLESGARGAAKDFLFSLADWSAGLRAALRPLHQAGLQRAGDQLFQELGLKVPFRIAPETSAIFAAERDDTVSRNANDIFDTVRSEIQEGLDAGEAAPQLGARVRGAFNELSKVRAAEMAGIETAAAFGAGRHLAMRAAGVRHKEWLSSEGAHARESHQEANGQVVGIDEAFLVSGEELRFPCDPNGRAENTINCHCVAVPANQF